jgi:RimJ/RimL family protein N-acetyltransferase
LVGEKDVWGQGITTNAVASVLDYLFFEQDFHRAQGGVCSSHNRSIQVFQKLGFRQESRLVEASIVDGQYEDDLKFGILKREWETSKFKGPRYKVHPLKWSYFAQSKTAGKA